MTRPARAWSAGCRLVTGSPASGRLGTATATDLPFAVFERQGGAGSGRSAQAGLDCPPHFHIAANVRECPDRTSPESVRQLCRRSRATVQPVRTPAEAAPPAGSTESPGSRGPTSRTSNPGSPPASTGTSRGESRRDGSSTKCDWPSRPSISRITLRSSPGSWRRARGAAARS